MTTRFWIGVAVGAVVAWYFTGPRGRGNGNGGGVGGGRPNRPRGQAGYSGFGRWTR
jgi:hypothetical protein